MDHQGGGTRPRHALGNPSGPQQAVPGGGPGNGTLGPGSGAQRAMGRDPARGYPPARTPQPHDEDSPGNAYSPVSGYRRDDWSEPQTGPSRQNPGERKPRRRLVPILA